MRVRQTLAERDGRGTNGQTGGQSIYLKKKKEEEERGIESKSEGMKCCCTWKAAATSAHP